MRYVEHFVLRLCVMVCVTVYCTGQVVVQKACKDKSVKEDFDVKKFVGRWYVHAQYGKLYETCVSLDLTLNEFFLGITRHVNFNTTSTKQRQYGLADPSHTSSNWSSLNVRFHKDCPDCSFWYIRSMRVVSVTYHYQAILYGCQPVDPRQYPHICAQEPCSEYTAWVMNRNKIWNKKDGWIRYAIAALSLDKSMVNYINHANC